MKIFLTILLAFSLTACGEKKAPAKSGYDSYVEVCTNDGESDEACKCRAEILKKYLTDEKISRFAEATAYISAGENDKSDEIIEKNPELVTALSKLSDEAAACDAQPIE